MKSCSCCKLEKSLDQFNKNKSQKDGYSNQCRDCTKSGYLKYRQKRIESKREYNKKNRTQINAKVREYNKLHKEEKRKYNKEYHAKNKEKIKQQKSEYIKNNYEKVQKSWANFYQKNKSKRRAYEAQKRKNDPLYRLASNCRRRLNSVLKYKYKNSYEYIGCDYKHLKNYLESRFKPGMTWDNYGTYWHIDHIIPLSSAKTEKELYKLCHYTNLQPLEAKENLRKGNRII